MKRIETSRMFKSFLSAKGISSLFTIAVIGLCLAFPVSKARMQQKQQKGSSAESSRRENQPTDQKAILRTRETVALPSKRYGAIPNGFTISHRLARFDRAKHKPSAQNQIGVSRPVNLSARDLALKGPAQARFNEDGSKVRFYTIQSPDALEIRVYFTNFNLPEGDEVYVYGTAPNSRVVGPYTNQGPFATDHSQAESESKEATRTTSDEGFWTGTIPGDTVIIEHYSKGEGGSFDVAKLAHHYDSVFKSEKVASSATPNGELGCHLDANCIDDPTIATLKDAVAKIVYQDAAGDSYSCSGTLINAKGNGFEPYFLTARHCISTYSEARWVDTHWSYRSTYCNSGQADAGAYVQDAGASILNTEQSSDQTLLRILKGIPSNAFYAGWTTEDFDAVPIVYGLHHPRGSYLRWSVGTVPFFDIDEDCDATGLTGGYGVTWVAGTTEHGSSGSGLFLPNGRLIGVDSCGNSECGGQARYGKLRNFYNSIAGYLEWGDYATPTPAVPYPKPNFSLSGSLTASSSRSPIRGIGFYARMVNFMGTAGQRIHIQMSSSDLSTHLALLSPVDRKLLVQAGNYDTTTLTLTLPESGEYLIEVSTGFINQTGAYNLEVTQDCSYSLGASEQHVSAGGGPTAFQLDTQSGCKPTVISNVPWVKIGYSFIVSGSQPITFFVDANDQNSARVGTISVEGQTFTVIQDGCSTVVQPGLTSFTRLGGNSTITVTATGACGWTAASQASWIKIVSGGSGSGGTVTYSVDANISPSSRTGTISIGGKLVTITQGGNVCTITPLAFGQTVNGQLSISDCYSPIGPGARYTDRYSFAGAAGQPIAIPMGSSVLDCYLRLIGPNGDIIASNENLRGTNARIPNQVGYLTLPTSGTYIIEALASPSTAQLGNYSLSLELSCQYTLSKTSIVIRSLGGSSSFTVTTTGNCFWTAKSNTPWITVTSGGRGTGSDTVAFFVAQNTGPAARTGTITVAGQTFTVSQQ